MNIRTSCTGLMLVTAALFLTAPLTAQEAEPPAAAVEQPATPAELPAALPTSPPVASVTKLSDLNITVEDVPPGLIGTGDFASRSAYRSFEMSPDGGHLAIKRIYEGKTDLLLLDAATKQPLKVFTVAQEQDLDWFRWAGNDKIIMSISMAGKFYDTPVRVKIGRAHV